MTGKGRVLLRRSIAPTFNTVDRLETAFHVNADKMLAPVDTPVSLVTLQQRRNDVNTRYARVELRIIEDRREVRAVLFDESGSAQERSAWLKLAHGWNRIELSWQSPGQVVLRAGGAETSIANPRRDQKVSELQLSFPSDDFDTGGYLCFDAIAAGLDRITIAGNAGS